MIGLPPMEEERLPNGARVVVARRPGVPLAAVRLLVRAGAALDPAGRHGLAHLVAQAARRGTRRRSGRRIDEEIEGLGAELGTGADEDATSFGLSAPAEWLPRLLDVVVDVATCPTFPQGELDRLRRREMASLVHDLDEPGFIADRAMLMAAYGEHPYGHPVEGRARDLAALRRRDAAGFHRRWYGPGVATLVIVGVVDPARALRLARRRLGSWRAAELEPPEVPAPAPLERRVWVVDKPDATQAQVRIAVPALPRRSREYFPAVVANTVLGGGFTSRLVQAIRVNRGLSYGARSRFSMSRSAGIFYVSSFTKVESTAELVEVALDEVRRFRDEGPSAEELERAKGYLCGLFPLSLETHDQIADKVCDLSLYGFGVEEVSGYRERVRAVTAEACREVARRHLPDGGGVIVVVGPAMSVAPAVERFGPVTVSPARRIL